MRGNDAYRRHPTSYRRHRPSFIRQSVCVESRPDEEARTMLPTNQLLFSVRPSVSPKETYGNLFLGVISNHS